MIKSIAIKTTGLVLAVLLAFSAVMLTGCGQKKNTDSSSSSSSKSSAISASPKSTKGDAYAGDVKIPDNAVKGTITVKDYGDIEFALLPDVAPRPLRTSKLWLTTSFTTALPSTELWRAL